MKKIVIRFDDETYDKLKKKAESDKRSMNSVVVIAVERDLNQPMTDVK